MKLQTFLLPVVTLTSAGNPAPEFGGLTVIDWTVKLAGETHTEVISDGQLLPWQLSYSMSTSTVNVVPALAAYLVWLALIVVELMEGGWKLPLKTLTNMSVMFNSAEWEVWVEVRWAGREVEIVDGVTSDPLDKPATAATTTTRTTMTATAFLPMADRPRRICKFA
jgi:hypothetical protein